MALKNTVMAGGCLLCVCELKPDLTREGRAEMKWPRTRLPLSMCGS